jgi:hypothetical protein
VLDLKEIKRLRSAGCVTKLKIKTTENDKVMMNRNPVLNSTLRERGSTKKKKKKRRIGEYLFSKYRCSRWCGVNGLMNRTFRIHRSPLKSAQKRFQTPKILDFCRTISSEWQRALVIRVGVLEKWSVPHAGECLRFSGTMGIGRTIYSTTRVSHRRIAEGACGSPVRAAEVCLGRIALRVGIFSDFSFLCR